MSTQHRTEGACQHFSKAKCLRGPGSEAAAASANETGVPSDFCPRRADGGHRKTEEDFTVGRVSRGSCCLLDLRAVVCLVSSVWSSLATILGADTCMQSSSRLIGPRLLPNPRLGVTRRSSSSPAPSSGASLGVHASGLDAKRCGQLFASPGGRGRENAPFLKRSENARDPAKPGLSVRTVDVLTHSHMESRGRSHMGEWLHLLRVSWQQQPQQKLLGFFICQLKRCVAAVSSLFFFHPQVSGMRPFCCIRTWSSEGFRPAVFNHSNNPKTDIQMFLLQPDDCS